MQSTLVTHDIHDDIEPVAVWVRRVGVIYEVIVEGLLGEQDIAATTMDLNEAEDRAALLSKLYAT